MSSIVDALETLKGTNIPAILVVAGIIFILLAMAGGFTGKIHIPKQRQKWAGVIGAFLLLAGLCLFAFPVSSTPDGPEEPNKLSPPEDDDATPVDSRQSLYREIETRQRNGLAALNSRDLVKAGAILGEAETLINEALDKSPKDVMLLNQKGYLHKNWAFAYRRQKMEAEAQERIHEAEDAFRQILKIEANDASALNGLGNVYIFRRQWDEAEEYVSKALEINPNYPAAKNDLALIRRLRDAESPD
jgi:tetratricopeptide (TPR) repeat protein